MDELNKIVLIGAGNVATQLGKILIKSGREIIQVYSRTAESAEALSKILKSEFINEIGKIRKDADLYILSVSDRAIEELVKKLSIENKLVVHTSGSVPMEILKPASENYGVLYPFQTFSKIRSVSFKSTPVCIEANNIIVLELLKKLAFSISDKVIELNSEQRKILHLSGVFACNFPNFMYSIAATILEENNIKFELLKPLILETAEMVQTLKPSEVQTGPAIRGDNKIMNTHLDLLEKYPEFRDLYRIISIEIGKSKGQRAESLELRYKEQAKSEKK